MSHITRYDKKKRELAPIKAAAMPSRQNRISQEQN
jgi:hypothetical protein